MMQDYEAAFCWATLLAAASWVARGGSIDDRRLGSRQSFRQAAEESIRIAFQDQNDRARRGGAHSSVVPSSLPKDPTPRWLADAGNQFRARFSFAPYGLSAAGDLVAPPGVAYDDLERAGAAP